MLNNVILIGRLVRDPELKVTPSGVAICNFTIAVDRFKKDDPADFIPIVAFRQQAEATANYQRKGSLVAVEGRMQTRNYEKDGRKVYVTEVMADDVRFLESAKSGNSGSNPPKNDDRAPWETDDFPL